MATEPDSVTLWLKQISDGDPRAAEEIWKRFFERLVKLADRKMHRLKRTYDAEDAALSAMDSFFVGAKQGRFPDLNDRHDLWRLLCVITSRKIARRTKEQMRLKRGGGELRGESVFASANDSVQDAGINEVIGDSPTPAFAAELADFYNSTLNDLEEQGLREYAEWKLEGLTVEEMAERKGCSKRTIIRKLERIRSMFKLADDAE